MSFVMSKRQRVGRSENLALAEVKYAGYAEEAVGWLVDDVKAL